VGPARPAAATHGAAQHDAGDRLLLLVQRLVERLERRVEGLHLLHTLLHALGGAVEPVGQRGRGGTLLAALLALLARLLAGGETGAQLLLDGRPQFELGLVELERLLHHGDAAVLQAAESVRRHAGRSLALLLGLRLGLLARLLCQQDAGRDGRSQHGGDDISVSFGTHLRVSPLASGS
jgi:hypothetical protein